MRWGDGKDEGDGGDGGDIAVASSVRTSTDDKT
ncbi:hypothetical protein NIES4103_37560 [Nostoc sp. NIES-4103]|nr:hypothetical protein NIES4103_37560 [Nostoc sp. NIES-4103]